MYRHQEDAVNASIQNDFRSGVHSHATGTGKTMIALKILSEFHMRHPDKNIIWLCEYKWVLCEQFSKRLDLKKHFHVLDLTKKNRPPDWVASLNSARFWKKPILLIINRALLTNRNKYMRIRLPIHLVLHDECHTIRNPSTMEFYQWITRVYNTRCIGFSATPTLVSPFQEVLTSFSMYDAFLRGIILPPRIVWFPYGRLSKVLPSLLETLPFKKIIIWCGMIDHCVRMSLEFKKMFPGFRICIDTCLQTDGYKEFYRSESDAFLFTASKHREGSDIPRVDGCIFLDRVSKRDHRAFVQCVGRVLRREKNKTHGLVIDVCARNCMEVCQRFQPYLPPGLFPWKKETHHLIESVEMVASYAPVHEPIGCTLSDLKRAFVKECPVGEDYERRLDKECGMIFEKNLVPYLLRARKILDLVGNIPHITRGSCGSSLVCYLLGISHIDPVRHDIRFARFLNEFREALPDIDFDFPHHLRDEIFWKIQRENLGHVARISNHNVFHHRSALRHAIKNIAGIRHFIPARAISSIVSNMDVRIQEKVRTEVSRLVDTFRGFSLHCGGIVFYDKGLPSSLVHAVSGVIPQITLDKRDVARDGRFKIDILSSRGLSQLSSIKPDFCFNDNITIDPETIELLGRGDNIGITFAESPLLRKTFMLFRPKTIEHIAICLALIRPGAKEARGAGDYKNFLVFDDDAIDVISRVMKCSDDRADQYRRILMKNKKAMLPHPSLKNLRKYSFCKAHALSYARLVYQLAYYKTHHPQSFWVSTLKNCRSMYREWVHQYEARRCGVLNDTLEVSIYTEHRRKNTLWDMSNGAFYPDCFLVMGNDSSCHFKGIIAFSRRVKPMTYVLFIGTSPGEYIEVIYTSRLLIETCDKIGVKGFGIVQDKGVKTITTTLCEFF